jgi:hypothetical protein
MTMLCWSALFVFFVSSLVGTCLADEENNENNNNAAANAYYSSLQQGPCFNVKIQDEEDEEGNSYFYNGAYRAQYQRYISFTACIAAENEGEAESCSLFVSDLEDFIEPAVEYLQNYCATCLQTCRRNLRFLEDQEQQGENYAVSVDCSSCSDQCSYQYTDYEINNLECQEAQDDNGNRRLDEDGDLQYYTAPGCYNGQVVIGKFYDDECSIKASMIQQEYPLFDALSQFRMDCSNNNQVCQELLNGAVSCADANNGGDDDIKKLCNSASHATRARTYARKRKWYQRPGTWFALFLLAAAVVGALGFLSYTYYVRHKSSRKVPLASLDQEPKPGDQQQTGESTGMGESPPWAKVN